MVSSALQQLLSTDEAAANGAAAPAGPVGCDAAGSGQPDLSIQPLALNGAVLPQNNIFMPQRERERELEKMKKQLAMHWRPGIVSHSEGDAPTIWKKFWAMRMWSFCSDC